MPPKVSPNLDAIPIRSLKCELKRGEHEVQELNKQAGDVLNRARFLAGVEPKAVADGAGISHSLVLRAFKGEGDIGFVRLWNAMPDAFWLELGMLILKTRGSKRVRHSFEIEEERTA